MSLMEDILEEELKVILHNFEKEKSLSLMVWN